MFFIWFLRSDVGLQGERKTGRAVRRIHENPSLVGARDLSRCQVGRSTCASWVREVTPSFTKTLRRWYSTVLVVM